MKIQRARMYHSASLEMNEDQIREIEQMIDLGDATAEEWTGGGWPTHVVKTHYRDGQCFKEYFVQEEA